MATVFISYGRESQPKAKSLAEDLEALGHQVWIDHELTGGQAWWNHILTRIQQCNILAFVLSPESLDSPACKREYIYASKLGKSILPILATDGVSIELLPSVLAQIQFVDYRKEDREALRSLSKALAALPPSPPLPDPLPEAPAAPVSYLSSLREQIEATEALSSQTQSEIVLRLKQGLRDAKDAEHVRTLLRRFRSRDDLYARVADEIDALLGSAPAQPVAGKPRADRSEPVSQSDPPVKTAARPAGGRAFESRTGAVAPELTLADVGESGSERIPLKVVWLSLLGGLLVAAGSNVIMFGGTVFVPSIVRGYLFGSWSIPAAMLLTAAIVWKQISAKPALLKLTFLLVPIVAGFLLSVIGFRVRPWNLSFIALEALIPLVFVAAVFWRETAAKPASIKLALLSLVGGLVCSAVVGLWVWYLIGYLEPLLATVFVIYLLAVLLKGWRRRKDKLLDR